MSSKGQHTVASWPKPMRTEAARPCLFQGRAKPPGAKKAQQPTLQRPIQGCAVETEEQRPLPHLRVKLSAYLPVSKAEPSLRESLRVVGSSSRKLLFVARRAEVPCVAPALACLSCCPAQSHVAAQHSSGVPYQ